MITALLVSVNYSDCLKVALPYNVLQFDQIIILTIESDKACQEVCSKHSNVKCLVFPDNLIKKNGRQFNKGALINKGFEYLNEIGYSDWLVMTDSDIVFPENFKELILSKEKDPNILYGMGRKTCNSSTDIENQIRLIDNTNTKEAFFGFCQIFMYKTNEFKYEEHNVVRGDVIFLSQFSEELRKLPIPERWRQKTFKNIPNFITLPINVIHLGESGVNWTGRKSQTFV